MARPKDLGLEHTWRLRLRRQATSSLSIPDFCRREGVSTASFYAWKRRLIAPPVTTPSDPPLFVPIRLDPSIRPDGTPPALGFEIELQLRVTVFEDLGRKKVARVAVVAFLDDFDVDSLFRTREFARNVQRFFAQA